MEFKSLHWSLSNGFSHYTIESTFALESDQYILGRNPIFANIYFLHFKESDIQKTFLKYSNVIVLVCKTGASLNLVEEICRFWLLMATSFPVKSQLSLAFIKEHEKREKLCSKFQS